MIHKSTVQADVQQTKIKLRVKADEKKSPEKEKLSWWKNLL